MTDLFWVRDKKTGEKVESHNLPKYAWACGLNDREMDEGPIVDWAISSHGQLFLLNDYGQCAVPPPERFEVVWNEITLTVAGIEKGKPSVCDEEGG